MKKLLIFMTFLLAVTADTAAQPISIVGKVVDDQGENVMGAAVQVRQGLISKYGTWTNENGEYTTKGLDTGRYDVRVIYSGFRTSVIKNVVLFTGRPAEVNVQLTPATVHDTIQFKTYRVPAIDKYNPGKSTTITAEEIDKTVCRGTSHRLSVSCAHEEGTLYHINEVPAQTPAKKSLWQRLKFWK